MLSRPHVCKMLLLLPREPCEPYRVHVAEANVNQPDLHWLQKPGPVIGSPLQPVSHSTHIFAAILMTPSSL
jgi:hypothetical protein